MTWLDNINADCSLPARPQSLLLVYADAWQERWPGAGPDGLGPEHGGWIAHHGFWRRSAEAVLHYRRHFLAILAAERAEDQAKVRDWLLADLASPRQFFSALRRELLDRLSRLLGLNTIMAERPWRAGITLSPCGLVRP